MNLNDLQAFVTVAECASFSRAAERLHVTQPAVSKRIQGLEGLLGCRLFDRVGKRLQLSELGRQLRPRAETLLEQARAFEQALAGEEVMGRLQVGATLTIGNYLAVAMIAEFRRRYPGAEIALGVANTEAIAAQVASFELDMGLVEGELNHPELESIPWRADELVVFAAPDHPMARSRGLGDRALRQLPWILREPGSGTRQAFDRAMHGLLPELDIAMELQHTEAIKRAVEAGLGVGCLSRISLVDAFRRGSLVPLKVPGRDFSRELYLVTHRRKYHGTALRRWLELCREYD